MTDTPRFTAAEVRAARQQWLHEAVLADSHSSTVDGLAAMLDAFAQRLEQEGYFQGYKSDLPHPRMAATGTEGRCELCRLVDSPLHGTPEQWREEGRREVLREIAKRDPFDPTGDMGMCNFCFDGNWDEDRSATNGHRPTCLWLRAQEATT